MESSLLKTKGFNVDKASQHRKREKHKKFENEKKSLDEYRLVRLPLTADALEGVPFFSPLTWTTNYIVFALGVYIISEAFTALFPLNQDRNISLIWLLCSLIFILHVLAKITAKKMTADELHAERNILLCFAALFFLLFLILLAFADELLDINIQQGYNQLTASVNIYLQEQGFEEIFDNDKRCSMLLVVMLSVIFSTFATIFLFPNVQYATLYLESVNQCLPFMKILLHSTALLPVICFFSFVKSVKLYVLETANLSEDLYETFRIVLILAWCLLRYLTAKHHLRTFLDQPKRKMNEICKNERLEECEKKVAYYASYFCVTSFQYFGPTLVVLFSALLLKSLGNIQFLNVGTMEKGTYISAGHSQNITQNNIVSILLEDTIQKPIWTMITIVFLGINSSLSLIGVIFKRMELI